MRRGSATKVATAEAAIGCGPVASRAADWTDGGVSVGGVCEFVGPTMDESRCGAAAADASPGETAATGALRGSGVVATTAFSSSDARPLRLRDITILAAEAMALRPAVESERKEEAGCDADASGASLCPSTETCGDAVGVDCEAISERLPEAPIVDAIVDATPGDQTRGSTA